MKSLHEEHRLICFKVNDQVKNIVSDKENSLMHARLETKIWDSIHGQINFHVEDQVNENLR